MHANKKQLDRRAMKRFGVPFDELPWSKKQIIINNVVIREKGAAR